MLLDWIFYSVHEFQDISLESVYFICGLFNDASSILVRVITSNNVVNE
jgi:hypothetical protein